MPEGSGHHVEAPGAATVAGFLATGQPAAGEFHCSGCGYGVIVHAQLPRCPMCGGTAWGQAGAGAIRRRLALERLQ